MTDDGVGQRTTESRNPEPNYPDPEWETVRGYEDITYRRSGGVARIAIDRPEVRNAFRPETLLFYRTEQVQEAKNAFLERRKPDFRKYPWLPW